MLKETAASIKSCMEKCCIATFVLSFFLKRSLENVIFMLYQGALNIYIN